MCVFFNVDHFFKDFIEFITILLLFYFLDFGSQARGILAPPPGMEPAPPALEPKVGVPNLQPRSGTRVTCSASLLSQLLAVILRAVPSVT